MKNTMKKYEKKLVSIICLVCFIVLSLCGCGNTTAVNQQTNDLTEVEPMEKEPTTAPMNETTQETEADELSKIADPFTLTFIGHASVKIKSKSSKVIYIDPNYSQGDYTEEADFILVTHAHDDHKPCDKVIPKADCVTITSKEALKDGVYETYDYGDIQIEAVPAGGNGNHAIGSGVGYIVTVDGISIYHAGDTSMIDEMADLTERNLDYAMYPIDGLYNMNAKAATEVANLVAAKHNIPIHDFNGFEEHKEDKFTPEGKLVLDKGETISLGTEPLS